LPISGSKKEIIQRILDHFEGKVPVTKKRKAAGGKKGSPAKKKSQNILRKRSYSKKR